MFEMDQNKIIFEGDGSLWEEGVDLGTCGTGLGMALTGGLAPDRAISMEEDSWDSLTG